MSNYKSAKNEYHRTLLRKLMLIEMTAKAQDDIFTENHDSSKVKIWLKK